ncbi:unnamed protein product [Musa banksii]
MKMAWCSELTLVAQYYYPAMGWQFWTHHKHDMHYALTRLIQIDDDNNNN